MVMLDDGGDGVPLDDGGDGILLDDSGDGVSLDDGGDRVLLDDGGDGVHIDGNKIFGDKGPKSVRDGQGKLSADGLGLSPDVELDCIKVVSFVGRSIVTLFADTSDWLLCSGSDEVLTLCCTSS